MMDDGCVLRLVTKQQLREKVWNELESHRVARFPGARRRIPNFIGAERCAQQVETLDVWKRARVIKANPDSPQRAIRHLALKQGKTIYMAAMKNALSSSTRLNWGETSTRRPASRARLNLADRWPSLKCGRST
jgi:5-formyltetrahydrofolate cyclo-ligase